LVSPGADKKEFSRKFTLPDILMETESKRLPNSETKAGTKTNSVPEQNAYTGRQHRQASKPRAKVISRVTAT
jgi:hypothetical protein